MPTRKQGIILFLVGGIMLVLGFAVFRYQYHPKKIRTTKASGEYNYETASYGQVINNGQTYLINSFDKISPNRRLVLDLLQRKYGLNKHFSAEYSAITPPIKGQQEDPVQFTAFERIAYPDRLVTVLPPAKDDAMTQMMMAAMQCDHIPLAADFGKLVQSNIDAGGYNLTHVEFSIQRMKENGCNFFNPAQEQGILAAIAVRMTELVSAPTTIPDLRYEAIAFLLDMDRRDLVQSAWIQQIITEQKGDGGWRAHPSEVSKDDDHATILALWALLAYTRPNASNEPMIHT